MEDEEDEEEGIDEETVSVTSSSQDSADKLRYQKWGDGGPAYRSSAGGLPEDPNDPSRGENGGGGHRGPRCHRGQRGELDPQGKMELLDLWDLLAQEDFLGGMGYPPPWDLLLLLD